MEGSRSLIFSMAFNYYDAIYARNIETHRAYAGRFGHAQVFVDRPRLTPLMMESAWLKIPLLLSALAAGWEWILFLDADTEVTPRAPDFRTLAEDGKDIYLARGFSGRVNSGVILLRNTEPVRGLVRTILDHAGMKLPAEDVVGWGENGEVIHFTRTYPGLATIDGRWNNNSDPALDDYVRHYSAGVMRPYYRLTPEEQDFSRKADEYRRASGAFNKPGEATFYAELQKLFDEAIAGRPEFQPIRIAAREPVGT